MNTAQDSMYVLRQSLNIDEFKTKTVKKVLKEVEEFSGYNETNPDPQRAFPGIDGKWYVIDFPKGRYNCYMFALGWTIEVGNKIGYGYPGIMEGKFPNSKMECLTSILGDLKAVGRDVHEIIMGDFPEKLPKAEEGTYWVKLFFLEGSTDDDWSYFHVARKDETSGRWLHKLGWFSKCKVLTNNFEFVNIVDFMLANSDELRKSLNRVPKNKIRNLVASMGFNPNEKVVTKSELETRDDAPYKAYESDEDSDKFKVFMPYAILRIDE